MDGMHSIKPSQDKNMSIFVVGLRLELGLIARGCAEFLTQCEVCVFHMHTIL